MTPQHFIAVGVRLVAIWLAIRSARFFTSVPVLLDSMDRDDRLLQFLLYGGLHLLIAAVLWMFPMTVARKILPHVSPAVAMTFSAHDLARVGCALVGLWLLVSKFYIFSWLICTEAIDPSFRITELPSETKVDLAVSLGELILAVFLVVRSDLFARVIGSERPLA